MICFDPKIVLELQKAAKQRQLQKMDALLTKTSLIRGHSETTIWKDSEGPIHRFTDKPSVVKKSPYGNSFKWFEHGKLHRSDGPAVVDEELDRKEYWQNNKRHRLNGPAVESKSYKAWYVDGKKSIELEDLLLFKEPVVNGF